VIRLTTITLRHFDAGERAPSTTPEAPVSNRSKEAAYSITWSAARSRPRGTSIPSNASGIKFPRHTKTHVDELAVFGLLPAVG
jgi:hypothetical protein